MGVGVFVLGTDTEIGKTAVSCALIRSLRDAGRDATGFKPIETDCPPGADGGWQPGVDAHELAQASNRTPDQTSSICLPEPLAPNESARRAAIDINYEKLISTIESRTKPSAVTIVEGAGGLLVPIDEQHTWLDVLRDTGLPTLLVAGNKLGVLNHTLLTVQTLQHYGLPLLGVVLNDFLPGPKSAAQQTNLAALRRLLQPTPVLAMPHFLKDNAGLCGLAAQTIAALIPQIEPKV